MTATYEFHPFCDLWPMMEGEDFESLALNIAAFGLVDPILLYAGMILDGRNRYRACAEAGVEPRYEQAPAKNDEEALELVFSLNQLRRHLSKVERAFAAAKYATLKAGQRGKGRKRKALSFERAFSDTKKTMADAAKKFDVSVPAVADARAIRTHAPELEEPVRKKKVSLRKAATDARAKGQALRTPPAPKEGKKGGTSGLPPVVIGPGPVKSLKPQEVDPDFKGTPLEFAQKYGHVPQNTAEKHASERFANWSVAMAKIAKASKVGTDYREVDLAWLRSARPSDVQRMRAALDTLRPLIAKAEAMLARAEQVAAIRRGDAPAGAGEAPTRLQ